MIADSTLLGSHVTLLGTPAVAAEGLSAGHEGTLVAFDLCVVQDRPYAQPGYIGVFLLRIGPRLATLSDQDFLLTPPLTTPPAKPAA